MSLGVLVTASSRDHTSDMEMFVKEQELALLMQVDLMPIIALPTMPTEQLEQLLVLADAVYIPAGSYQPQTAKETIAESIANAKSYGLAWDPLKVALDRLILQAAWQRYLPTLAVGSGFGSMVTLDGGRLSYVKNLQTKKQDIDTPDDSLLRDALGPRFRFTSNSPQVVSEPGEKLIISAKKGTPVAVEAARAEHPFWLGLSWTPDLPGPVKALATAALSRDRGEHDHLIYQ